MNGNLLSFQLLTSVEYLRYS